MGEKRYSLRPANDADFEFLYHLNVVCLKEYVAATWGWDDAYQRRRFTSHWDPAKSQIIVVDGRDVGRLSVEDRSEYLFLSVILLLPEVQRQGLGTNIIEDLLRDAEKSDRFVKLQVLKVNPTLRLYQRLGFEAIEENETHYVMTSC